MPYIKVPRTRLALGGLVALALVATMATPATAAQQDNLSPTDVVRAISLIAPEVFREADAKALITNRGVTSSVKSGTVVSLDPRDPLQIDGTLGSPLSIGVPFASTTDRGALINDWVVFDHSNGISTVPVIKDDGSVQITSVIENASAPTRIPYPVSTPGLAQIITLHSGGLVLVDAEGGYLGSVMPPWATDASGKAIPTRFEVDNHQITQVVDHTAGKTSYPVIADPWFGIDIWIGTTTSRGPYLGQPRYSAMLSLHGRLIYMGIPTIGFPGGIPFGYVIINSAGWSELVTKLPGVTSKATLHQQFVCHVNFGYPIWGSGFWWDLEKARADKPDWNNNVSSHLCNW